MKIKKNKITLWNTLPTQNISHTRWSKNNNFMCLKIFILNVMGISPRSFSIWGVHLSLYLLFFWIFCIALAPVVMFVNLYCYIMSTCSCLLFFILVSCRRHLLCLSSLFQNHLSFYFLHRVSDCFSCSSCFFSIY